MPEYIVKTRENRNNPIIQADYFEADALNYNFYTKADDQPRVLVASVGNSSQILGVLEYFEDQPDTPGGDECDGTCPDCLAERIVETPGFQDAVWSAVVDFFAPADAIPEIECWEKDGDVLWGFHTPEGFIDFSAKDYAETGLEMHLKGDRSFSYFDLTGYTKKEVL